jgi:hypothetical protein
MRMVNPSAPKNVGPNPAPTTPRGGVPSGFRPPLGIHGLPAQTGGGLPAQRGGPNPAPTMPRGGVPSGFRPPLGIHGLPAQTGGGLPRSMMAKGGKVRGDGICQRGKTKGRFV